MSNLFSVIIYTNGVLAAAMMFQAYFFDRKQGLENRLWMAACLGSAVWSFGSTVCTRETAWMLLAGSAVYMVALVLLFCRVTEMPPVWHVVSAVCAAFAAILYYGMPTAGLAVYAILLLALVLYVWKTAKAKHFRVLARRFLWLAVLIAAGIGCIPCLCEGSLTQFWGLLFVHYALCSNRSSRIQVDNISKFVYHSLSAPVFVYDNERHLQLINDAAVSFLQIERKDLKKHNIWINQIFEIDPEEVFFHEGTSKEFDIVCKKNKCLCSLNVNRIIDKYGDGIGYLMIAGDLSERVRVVKELEEAKKQADAANSAKSAFLANMSHEIRTPMNAIVGFSELALSEELDPKIHEYIVDIRSASHNLLAIINDILDISKIESGKMELVCGEYYTKNLFNDIFLIVDGQAKKKGLEFQMSVSEDLPRKMYGDKVRLREILINLLNNAVKYTDAGKVELEAQVLDKSDDIATLKLAVKDTGIGISEEDQKKLFETFSQVDKTVNYGKEGSGLGLAIVRGFLNLMDGEVSVESEPGKGSVFTVIVGQKILDDTAADQIYTSSDEVSEDYGMSDMKLEDVRVLVVDDNIMNLKMAKNSMEHYGLKTDIAGSGKLAIEMCSQTHYQIVFMDQMMPVMNGIEAMKEIRKLDKYYEIGGPAKIIILTANTMNGMREQMMEEGFDEFLGKPLNFKQLERLLKRFLPNQMK